MRITVGFLLYPPILGTVVDTQRITRACPKPLIERFAGHISDPVARLRFLRAVAPPPVRRTRRRVPVFVYPLLAVLAISGTFLGLETRAKPALDPGLHAVQNIEAAAKSGIPKMSADRVFDVWLVEKSGDVETYSNGLRIDGRFATSNHPRSYVAFPAAHPDVAVTRSEPVGIVFHTTESAQAPFEARQNGVLRRIGESLLDYVRRRRAYHFLIDRFGRVYRVVSESDAANHAGYSVWADEKWLYINLNESFFGVSFEAQTQPGQTESAISPAQVRGAAMLTEMLRAKYRIAPGNCVTHAQVSVNPSNMRIGYHTDWASSFPYEQLALPNNYARDLPSLDVFGFEYDSGFLEKTGGRMAVGVAAAEAKLKEKAARSGLTADAYRRALQTAYRARLEAFRQHAAGGAAESE
ncbi:MAG: peptidoglycan recognition family protein [Bryobacteraceae bacterium]